MRKIVLFTWLAALSGAFPVWGAPFHIRGDHRCLDCHVSLPLEDVPLLFHSDVNEVCFKCHDRYPCAPEGSGGSGFIHPVNVVPSFKLPKDMPLDVERKIGCMTCHVYHDDNKAPEDMNRFLLRRPAGLTFCYTCHKKLS